MGALILNTCPFSSESLITSSNKWNHFSMKRKSISVYCQSVGKAIKSGGFSSVLTDSSTLVSTNHGASVMDAASLVLSPTGANQGEVAVKDLVPYGGGSTPSFVDIQEAIGIVKFIKGKFLITGATGFLGKVLIEKILRTVPDVGKIFLLIKAKNKEAAMERLKEEIINSELFKCLQQAHGISYQALMLSKLVPVVGNACDSNLGLDEDLANVLRKEVEVIINSTANTTFDERYDVALNINTRGAFHIMSFARKCKKLELILQVSTAYVNGQRQGRIMEKPFCVGESIVGEYLISETPKLDIETEIKLALDSQVAFKDNVMAQKMKQLGLERANSYGWQDTYVFTKAMGEMLIDNMRGETPVVIIRPSVIESTFKEPFPGWMEGNRHDDGSDSFELWKGQLTGFLVDPNGILDVIPADMVVNATLAAIAKHGAEGKPGINVYQIASSVVNPLVFGELAKLLYEHFNSLPYKDSKGMPIQVPTMQLFSSMEDFSSHLWRDAIQRSGLSSMTTNRKLSQKLENIYQKSVEQVKYLANI